MKTLLTALLFLLPCGASFAEGGADVQMLPDGRVEVKVASTLQPNTVALQVRAQPNAPWQHLTLWNGDAGQMTATPPNLRGNYDLRVLVFSRQGLVDTSTFSVEEEAEMLTKR